MLPAFFTQKQKDNCDLVIVNKKSEKYLAEK